MIRTLLIWYSNSLKLSGCWMGSVQFWMGVCLQCLFTLLNSAKYWTCIWNSSMVAQMAEQMTWDRKVIRQLTWQIMFYLWISILFLMQRKLQQSSCKVLSNCDIYIKVYYYIKPNGSVIGMLGVQIATVCLFGYVTRKCLLKVSKI